MARSRGCVLLLAVGVLRFAGPAIAAPVTGRVLVDRDGDGLPSAPDTPLAGAVVFWETSRLAMTDEQGAFALEVPGPGIVWVRTPDEIAPGPVWVPIADDASGETVELLVAPATATGPLQFIAASDSHAGISSFGPGDVERALDQAVGMLPDAHFAVITGDITQSNQPEQFDEIMAAVELLPVPFVPVPGNHDWYDGGAAYRAHFGPPSYAFDSGGVHVVVLNDAAGFQQRVDFVARDLALIRDERPVVAFMHASPDPELVTELQDAGVDYLFTGHMHANRFFDHGSLIEYNTQPLVMAGIDHSPAGYRLVSLAGGALSVTHETIVERPIVELVAPPPGAVVCGGRVEVIATTAGELRPAAVYARVDDGELVELERERGWTYRGAVFADHWGDHPISLWVDHGSGPSRRLGARFQVGAEREILGAGMAGDWAQANGGASHDGYRTFVVEPPLREIWRTSVDGQLHGGAPVVVGDTVYVSVVDFADASGGVVALRLADGSLRWRAEATGAVRNAPAVADGVTVFLSLDGALHAVSAATGEPLWSYDLASDVDDPRRRDAYSSPVIADGVVYAGIQRELAAFDLPTGRVLWSVVPHDDGGESSTYSSLAVESGLLVASFARGLQGLFAFDPQTGEELWRTDQHVSIGSETSPVIVGDTVYVANWLSDLFAVDLFSGEQRWRHRVTEGTFPWAYAIFATPAYADGTLFVPTSFGYLHAIDAATGDERWRLEAGEGLVHPAHYQSVARAFTTAPIVTGDLLWIAGADGVLQAVDTATGARVWSYRSAAPLLMAPAPVDGGLVVGSYDGVVRFLASDGAPTARVACPAPPPDDGGCASVGGGTRSPGCALALLVALIASLRRRRGARLNGRDEVARDRAVDGAGGL